MLCVLRGEVIGFRTKNALMTIIRLPVTGTIQENQYARHYQ
jgi:hypothetical protein